MPAFADMPWLLDLLLLLGGAVAGFVNAVAGGGSALTVPLLMLTGMDAAVANGTNRVAVAVQAATATGTFHRQRVRPWAKAGRAALFAIPGAIVGALVAVRVSPDALELLFGLLFLALAVLMLRRPTWLVPDPPADGAAERPATRWSGPALFAVGLYGGLLQAGVGIPLLVVMVRGLGLDLVRGNAAKAALVLIYTTLILLVFGAAGQVQWRAGAVLAAGGVLGSTLGARAAVARGSDFIRKALFVALILAGAKALGLFDLLGG